MTHGERIASLETMVISLKAANLDALEENKETNRKLDELLALKNKGAGVFFAMSLLFGLGTVGWISLVLNWLKFKT